ncbi:MAG: rhodanese-like domain-containing protein [Phycisphaerales bacterium]
MTTMTAPAAPTTAAKPVPPVAPAEAAEWIRAGRARLVDVREIEEFEHERIEGSVLMPLSQFNDVSAVLNPNDTIVVQCRSGRRSADAASRLAARGHKHVFNLAGGIVAWKAAGLPVSNPVRAPISPLRQAQIVIGLITLAGVALGIAVSPWFFSLSVLMGAGLVMAGMTGWCGLAVLMAAMPWNRRHDACGDGKCS